MTTITKNKNRIWNDEEDNLLKDCVLDNIRTGRTQLEAFEKVGKETSRTSGSVAFRWNNTLRKKYSIELRQAKEERKALKDSLNSNPNDNNEPKKLPTPPSNKETEEMISTNISYQDVFNFLKEKEKLEERLVTVTKAYDSLSEDFESLKIDFNEVVSVISKAKSREILKPE
ncbi:hypothetical protein MZM54_04285 [[Brevibacterium] frigoritolerans]|nr:hypothetical protein [Peribacillus frigoritolerans]